MFEEMKDDRHEALIDDEKVEWVPDVSPAVHSFIQRLLAEGKAFNNPIKVKLAEMYMRTGGTRDGRTANRILEAVKQQPEQIVEQDRLIDMPEAPEGSEERKKSHTDRFSLR